MDGEIDPDDLAALLAADEEGLRVVDIRDRRAFDRGHIPGSESVPFPELTTRVAELEGASRIVTVCPHGVASRQAADLVGSYAGTADARVESLRGGIEAWERDVGDLVANSDTDASATGSDSDEGPDAPF
ncbi:rhodanese-like domain-containing protein [Halorubrum sp. CBA1125]|uniref:rhodanese-like domain-containing protein n=1 Tax=Halorubrum sp. CBA1125 TaxID=2668072 RepID=UPI0012E9246B|nr:rhodanese-like domain-containing protein [Halorubrum sp. CBA1125]MUW13754.1 rhodanese-like domain-containing protein [Halorubrum sp. CBA1125]